MKRLWILLFIISVVSAPVLAHGQPFTIVGPRALGMGGAGVAAVNDSTAVYWNPAALADFRKLDIRIPAGAAIRDHIGLGDKWDRINEIYEMIDNLDYSALDELDQLLSDLDKPDTGTDLDAHAGLYVSIPFEKSAIAISAQAFGNAGLFPTIDTLNRNKDTSSLPLPSDSIVNNNSAVTGIGILTIEPAVSFATSLGDKVFIGANAKKIYASTYVHTETIRTGDFSTFIDNLDASETTSSKASADAGIIFKPTKTLSIGVVGRNLNSPSFPIKGFVAYRDGTGTVSTAYADREIELEPQYRAGIAIQPLSFLTISADYDISKNKSIGIPGFEDQTAAVGLELRLPKEIVSIRGGAYKNMADDNANVVYTAGVGVRLFFLRIDVAGAYDFEEQEAQASLDVAFRF